MRQRSDSWDLKLVAQWIAGPDLFSHSQPASSNKATINPEATDTAVVVFVFGYPVLMWE